MKKFFKAIALLAAPLFVLTAHASDDDKGYYMNKTVTQSPDVKGQYTITLETFVTGTTILGESALPCDIILVLDKSSSMRDNSVYEYTAVSGTSFTYNDLNDKNYYYQHDDGYYYRVRRGGDWRNGYYAYYRVGDVTYYFHNDGDGTINRTQPTNVTSQYGKIINNRTLYTRSNVGTRMAVLKSAAQDFIDVVAEKAKGNDGEWGGTGENQDIDHRICVISYDNNSTLELGMKEVNQDNLSALANSITGIAEDGSGTGPDNGLAAAVEEMAKIDPDRESNRVVVLFTDGEPYWKTGRNPDNAVGNNNQEKHEWIASHAIALAKDLKQTYGATVYTVSVTSEALAEYGDTYMHYVSSEYPCANSLTDNGTTETGGARVTSPVYYQKSDGSDLSAIFTSIATSAAADVYNLTETSMVVFDAMSEYFRVPKETNFDDIVVYTADYISTESEDAAGTRKFGPRSEPLTVVNSTDNIPEGAVAVILSATDDEGSKEVTVSGFNYAENFCGIHDLDPDHPGTNMQVKGKELIIEIPIEVDPRNEGGATLITNSPESGIYVYDENGDRKAVDKFVQPTVALPNIIIRAYGLGQNESASYTIYKLVTEIDESTIDDEGGFNFETYTDAIDPKFTPVHVILTETGDDGYTSAKIKLNSEGRYKVVEDSWAYTYSLSVGGKGAYGDYDVDNHQGDRTASTTTPDGAKVAGNAITRTICYGTQAHVNDNPENADHPFAGDGTLYDFYHTRGAGTQATHRGESAKSNWKTVIVPVNDGEEEVVTE